MSATPPLNPAPRPRGWWSRHWKWAVPALCVALLGLAVAGMIAVMSLAFTAIRSVEPVPEALALARAHPALREALGEPIDTGWWASGQVNYQGGSGRADISLPLRGPQGRATLHLDARRSAGRWEFRELIVDIEGGQRVDLLGATPAPTKPQPRRATP